MRASWWSSYVRSQVAWVSDALHYFAGEERNA